MRAVVSRPWLAVLGLLPSACALAGYDFGDYERASTNHEESTTGGVAEAAAGEAGEAGEAAGGQMSAMGGTASAGTGSVGPVASTFGAGGESTGSACQPQGCFEQQLECGLAPSGDGCGQPLDCGACFWWFQECRQNRCEITE